MTRAVLRRSPSLVVRHLAQEDDGIPPWRFVARRCLPPPKTRVREPQVMSSRVPSGRAFGLLRAVCVTAVLCALSSQAAAQQPVLSFNRAGNAADIANELDRRAEAKVENEGLVGADGGIQEIQVKDPPFAGRRPFDEALGGDNGLAAAQPDQPGLAAPAGQNAPAPPAPDFPQDVGNAGNAGNVRNAETVRNANMADMADNARNAPQNFRDGQRLSASDNSFRREVQADISEEVSRIRSQASEEIGDGNDILRIQTALRQQVAALEKLVLRKTGLELEGFSADERMRMVSICEDTKFELTSQKNAFQELLDEKKYLSKMLREEQAALDDLQEKVQNPDLSVWISKRTARVQQYFETPETDAVAYYANRFLKPKWVAAGSSISAFEGRLEKTVDTVLPAKYGNIVALLLAMTIVGFPVFVTFAAVRSISKSISMRQHVLLCDLFLAAFAVITALCGLVLREDPLRTLYSASESGFVTLQFALVIFYLGSVFVLARALYNSRDERDIVVFGSQVIFYLLVGYNYHQRVIMPALLGYQIDTSVTMYIVYAVDFVAMTALTVSSAMPQEKGDLPRHNRDTPEWSGRKQRKNSSTAADEEDGGASSQVSDAISRMAGSFVEEKRE